MRQMLRWYARFVGQPHQDMISLRSVYGDIWMFAGFRYLSIVGYRDANARNMESDDCARHGREDVHILQWGSRNLQSRFYWRQRVFRALVDCWASIGGKGSVSENGPYGWR